MEIKIKKSKNTSFLQNLKVDLFHLYLTATSNGRNGSREGIRKYAIEGQSKLFQTPENVRNTHLKCSTAIRNNGSSIYSKRASPLRLINRF